MAEVTLRLTGYCLALRLRAVDEPWVPLPVATPADTAAVWPSPSPAGTTNGAPLVDFTHHLLSPAARSDLPASAAHASVSELSNAAMVAVHAANDAAAAEQVAAAQAQQAMLRVQQALHPSAAESDMPRCYPTADSEGINSNAVSSCVVSSVGTGSRPVNLGDHSSRSLAKTKFPSDGSSTTRAVPCLAKSHPLVAGTPASVPHGSNSRWHTLAHDALQGADDVNWDDADTIAEEEEEEEEATAPVAGDGKSDCLWWLDSAHPLVRFLEVATLLVILVSVFSFVIETIPRYNSMQQDRDTTHPVFFAIESFCIAWFTIEYSMRLYAAKGHRLQWMRQGLNVVDLVAIVPYYLSISLNISALSTLAVVRVLRLSRVIRLFKVFRHLRGMQVGGKHRC